MFKSLPTVMQTEEIVLLLVNLLLVILLPLVSLPSPGALKSKPLCLDPPLKLSIILWQLLLVNWFAEIPLGIFGRVSDHT